MNQAMIYVYEVYKEKSFSQAAKNLFISQPALSAYIKKTEEELGIQIFDRTSLPIRLTEAGELYVQAIRKIMAIEEELSNQIDELSNLKRGHLNVAGANFFSAYILPPIIHLFCQQYPGIDVQLIESDSNTLYQEALQNNIHLILDAGTCDQKIYSKETLITEKILFAVPMANPLNKKYRDIALTKEDVLEERHLNGSAPLPLEDFENERMILLKRGHDMHDRSIAICQDAGFQPRKPMYLNQLSTAANICAAGLGCCFLTDSLIKYGPIRDDTLLFYTLDAPEAHREMFIAVPKNTSKTQLMNLFIQAAREVYVGTPSPS